MGEGSLESSGGREGRPGALPLDPMKGEALQTQFLKSGGLGPPAPTDRAAKQIDGQGPGIPSTSESDDALARRIAEAAGRLLLAVRGSGLFAGRTLGAAGDRVANALIVEALKANRPEDAVLSEEEDADPVRLGRSRVWIVDPLDGTREYGEGRSDWAVHVGLAVDGVATAGAVALPGLGETFGADDACRVPAPAPARLRMLVSRTRPAAEAVRVAAGLGATLLPMGSAGAKAMAVVRGEADIYLHSGGQHEWDSCAPVAVARAAGLHASRLDGSALRYNAPGAFLPDLLVCRSELAERVLRVLAGCNAQVAR